MLAMTEVQPCTGSLSCHATSKSVEAVCGSVEVCTCHKNPHTCPCRLANQHGNRDAAMHNDTYTLAMRTRWNIGPRLPPHPLRHLDNDGDAAACDGRLDASAPAPASGSQAEGGLVEVIPVVWHLCMTTKGQKPKHLHQCVKIITCAVAEPTSGWRYDRHANTWRSPTLMRGHTFPHTFFHHPPSSRRS